MSGEGLREMTVAEMNELRAKAGLAPLIEDDAPSKVSNQKTVMQQEYEEDKTKKKEKEDLRGGIRVQHSYDDFEEETDTILVLEDKNILDDDDDDDVLVNLNLQDKERAKRNQELRRKKTIYDAYDEHERTGSILSKYDEKDDKNKGFVVSVDKTVQYKKPEDSMTVRGDSGMEGAILMSSSTEERKIASDYYTSDEAKIVFNKKREKKKVVKKKKNLKKRTMSVLKEIASEEGEHLMSREDLEKKKAMEEQKEIEEREARFKRYKMAEQLSSEQSKIVFEDDQEEGRMIKNLQRKKVVAKPKTEDIVKRVEESKKKIQAKKDEDGVVFSSVHEFLSAIPTGGGEDEEEEDIHKMLTFKKSEPEIMDIEDKESIDKEKEDIRSEERRDSITNDDRESMDIEEKELPSKPEVSGFIPTDLTTMEETSRSNNPKSLGATLALLRKTKGLLDKEVVVGRVNDKKNEVMGNPDVKDPDPDGLPEINLDEYDENGRLLTIKERYRKFSQAFHGKRPGKNKMEKRAKKLKELEKSKRQTFDDALKKLENIKKAQVDNKAPFLVLSGHKHLKK